jgi:hypothetical protein
LPDVSILFVGPMDRGERGGGGKIVTRPMIPKLIECDPRIAGDSGCGCFDAFAAMGGQGAVARGREAKSRLMGSEFTNLSNEVVDPEVERLSGFAVVPDISRCS